MSTGAVVQQRGDSVWWWCPGCEQAHRITTGRDGWTWDGDFEAPTFSPSVLCTIRGENPSRCHCFVRAGQIQFLNDCTHELAGQTVAVPELPEWMR